MKRSFIAAFAAVLAVTGPAFAAGEHGGGHGDAPFTVTAGSSNADRTIPISMVERDDGSMAFEPSAINVIAGETIEFEIRNDGEVSHEFVPGSHDQLMDHKAEMEAMPDMAHGDDSSVRLEPGRSGAILLTFDKSGSFEFACLIPGHYEAGMHGTLTVASATSKGN